MLDNWPKACYSNERSLAGSRFDRPAVGICFDIGKVNSGKYGQKCWETFWRAVKPRDIAGSLLLEGIILERDNVYCLAIHNGEAWRIEHIIETLEKDPDYLKVCAIPHFYEGEDVLREPLVAAGQVNEAGNIIGISYNARLALSQIRKERADAVPAPVSVGAMHANGKTSGTSMKIPPAVTASLQNKKWWHVWRL